MRTNAAHPAVLKFNLLWMTALLTAVAALTGCGAGRLLPPSAQAGASIHGHVHGGQQPVAGANVYLLAANTTGYAGAGITPSGANASISLLNSADTGNSDDIGAYVLTAADGTFDISGDYTCTPNTQVYLYAHGGNPGGGANSAAGFLALLGNCPDAGNFSAVPFIEMNEVSTVAAAYSFAGYASDPVHVSSNGSPQALTGIANAFATASNLVDLGSGDALATTPAGNGTVPQATINTLANILASCVNTADIFTPGVSNAPSPQAVHPQGARLPYSAPCTALGLASSGGNLNQFAGYTYDTATAAIFIAQAPAANTAALYVLPTPQAPFSPALTTQPSDFTLSIAYTGGGLTFAQQPAVDALGNVWVADTSGTGGNGAVAEFSPLGATLSSAWTQSNLNYPAYIAIDASGNAWLSNQQPGYGLTKYSSSGSDIATSGDPGFSYFLPGSPAIDASGNLWVTHSNSTNHLVEFYSSGIWTATYNGGGLSHPTGLAIDASGNLWTGNENTNTLSEFGPFGAAAAGTPFTLSDASQPTSVAVGGKNIWVLKQDASIDVLDSAGAEAPGSPFNSGYNSANSPTAHLQAIDGAGNDWIVAAVAKGSIFFPGPSTITSNLIEISSTGTALTSGLGYALNTSSSFGVGGIALDAAGNLWLTSASQLIEYIGLSTPIETPVVQALLDNCLAQRPCLPQP